MGAVKLDGVVYGKHIKNDKRSGHVSVRVMTEVLVLLCCESGCQEGMMDSLQAVPGVVEASAITGGAYDIIVRISAGSMAEAKSSISSGIKRIQGIKTSTVLIRKAEKQVPALGREPRFHPAAA